jgi:hypothetical protein
MQEFRYKLIDDETYCVMTYRGDEKEIVIPDLCNGKPVTVLYDDLFKGHAEITSVKIPDSVREIGGFVFDGCAGLKSVRLPASLESMWQYAFVRSSIEEIVIPDGVKQIIPFTFKDCKRLRKVVCGAGLRAVGAWAFEGCDALEEFVCGKDVDVSPEAFQRKKLNT